MKKVIAMFLSLMLVLAISLPAAAISKVDVKSIKFVNAAVSIKAGQSTILKIAYTPANTSQTALTFVTDNQNVATIDGSGKVTGINTGKATITAYAQNKAIFAKCTVTVSKLDPYQINWFFPNSAQPDVDLVAAEMSKITKAKINATLKMTIIDWGSYSQNLQIKMAAQEPMDLIWTDAGTLPYLPSVNKGAFTEITQDMLNQYGPNILRGVPTACWPAAKVNGKLYAIINTQVEGRTPGILFQKKYVTKFGLDLSKVKKLEDLTSFYEKVHGSDPTLVPFEVAQSTSGGIFFNEYSSTLGLELLGRQNPAAVYISDNATKVMNYFAAPETKAYLKLIHDWYLKGIIKKDAPMLKDVTPDQKAGKTISIPTVVNPDTAANVSSKLNLKAEDMAALTLSKTFMNTSSIIATMTAISKTSKNPARCVMLYNLLYDEKDTKLFNMMNYGIEEKHYTLKGDVATFVPNTGYMLASGWENGNMFNSYRQSEVQPKWYPVGPNMNNSATVSKLLGFNLNPEPIKTELAQVASVVDEFYGELFTGVADPETVLPQFLEKLKGAGTDKIISETQNQIDSWKKTR